MEGGGRVLQVTDNPGRAERRDNLYEPREDLAERSSLPGPSRKTSLFLEAQMHPAATVALLAGLGAVAFYGLRSRGRDARDDRSDVFARREHAARFWH
jgi:hypothetical protein